MSRSGNQNYRSRFSRFSCLKELDRSVTAEGVGVLMSAEREAACRDRAARIIAPVFSRFSCLKELDRSVTAEGVGVLMSAEREAACRDRAAKIIARVSPVSPA
jgi:hypothetical protein